MRFEWDPMKNKANILKHRVSFDVVETIFDDKNTKYIFDKAHSGGEEKFHIIGTSSDFRKMNVCHCHRGTENETIRIISARKATKTEIDYYYGRIEP